MRKAVSDLSEVDEPDRLAGARPWPQSPSRSFHPLGGGSDPPCWRFPFTPRPHAHSCRSLLLAPGSAKQGVVTVFARWASVGTSAHIYAATRHVVGEAQSLTSPRGLTRHPTGRGYAEDAAYLFRRILLPRRSCIREERKAGAPLFAPRPSSCSSL